MRIEVTAKPTPHLSALDASHTSIWASSLLQQWAHYRYPYRAFSDAVACGRCCRNKETGCLLHFKD